jgi:hypothetical protein
VRKCGCGVGDVFKAHSGTTLSILGHNLSKFVPLSAPTDLISLTRTYINEEGQKPGGGGGRVGVVYGGGRLPLEGVKLLHFLDKIMHTSVVTHQVGD